MGMELPPYCMHSSQAQVHTPACVGGGEPVWQEELGWTADTCASSAR